MVLSAADIAIMLGIGLVTGVVGGLVGLGGSIVMIPAMTWLFHGRAWDNQHLYQAAAMVMNVAVAVPATLRHQRARAIRWDLFRLMMVPTMLAMAAGVLVSNLFEGHRLEMVFAVFLVYVSTMTIVEMIRRTPDAPSGGAVITFPRAACVGGAMGFVGGLLGVGGGTVAVPLSRMLCRLPLRQAIAASSAVMGVTSLVGASMKIATLGGHGQSWRSALVLALVLSPTVVAGGYLGAGLTHRLPLGVVRGALVAFLLLAAAKMGGVL